MNWFRPLAAVLLLVSIPATISAAELSGLPITAIILKDDLGKPLPNVESLLPLIGSKAGDPFSREAVRKGVAYLYLAGKFRDIRVDAYSENGGVRLEYTVSPITIVDSIVLRGNHALPDRVVRDAARGIEGRELREDTFSDIRTNIQASYQAEGYYNTRVNFRYEPAPDPHRAVLFIYITEPGRTLIESILFKGNTVFPEKELLKVMQNRPGRPLRTNVLLEDDLEAIRKQYVAAGYPAASPGPVSMSFRDERAFLEIGGAEGPKVTVSFSGTRRFCEQYFPDLLYFDPDTGRTDVVNEEQCADHFRDLLLIWSEYNVLDPVIDSSRDKIRNVYRDLGYPDVKVSVKKTETPGGLDLAFTVQEGQKVTVGEVRVEGNSVFTATQIKAMMSTQASGWFRSRPFREDILEKDVDIITERYIADGYLAVNVKRTVTRTADGSKAAVALKITEGRKTLMGNVSFEGNAAVTSKDLAGVLKLKTAAPFNERLLEEDRYRVLSLYSAKGYLYARIEIERKPASAEETAGPEVVHVHYRIAEDRQVAVGKVILRGNVNTRDAVILRELEPRTGEPYSYEALLKSQQRVYRYGYFSLAKFEPVHPHEKEYIKDMLFTVEERPAGAVEFGVGYGTLDRLRGFVEISHRNLWGTARFASLRFEGSDILRREAFTFQEPWFLGQRYLESKFILARSDAKRINEQSREIYYQTRKTTASYGVERSYEGLRTSLTYQYENVENYNVQPAAELSPDDSGRVLISSLNPAIILDKRDDPFNPTRGSLHGVNIKEAMSVLNSKAEFTKATVQSTWYLPAADYLVIALSGRAGMGWPHRDTREVPLHERFYLGGGTTVRGYTQDSVGPYNIGISGDRVPTGGSGMVQFNAEARLSSSGGSGFVIFTDAGNVWVDQAIRMDDLRASYGAGFRYHTPVGPLRIDYGQKINRRSGESPGELHFNIGQAF
ncbi:MAG: outer membrane protein assembly factor BamA [Nitrospirota bacterium]